MHRIALLFILAGTGFLSARSIRLPELPSKIALIEQYHYESTPVKKKNAAIETIDVRIIRNKNLLTYTSTRNTAEGIRTTELFLEPDGTFLTGFRKNTAPGGLTKNQSTIKKSHEAIMVHRMIKDTAKVKKHAIPKDKQIAVDASLLVLMRSFPFSTDTVWHIFMVDFSGHTISVTVKNAGTEDISVPAGTFACYRMDVTVNLWFFRPKITYWLSIEKPHFLVKHHGRQGPFTSRYTTVLTNID